MVGPLRRGGRVAEGARLESVYRVYSSIEGSNPSPSAKRHSAQIQMCVGRSKKIKFQLDDFDVGIKKTLQLFNVFFSYIIFFTIFDSWFIPSENRVGD